MRSIRSHFVKLFSILLISIIFISLPSLIALADARKIPVKTPALTTVIEKTTTWGGAGDDDALNTVVDKSGNVYVSGYFNGTVDFNPGSGVNLHTSNGGRDVFLSKFDASGAFVWAKTWGGTNDERGEGLALDSSGNVYVAGPFQGTVAFNPAGGASHTSNAGSMNNIFLSKFDPDGNFQWVRTWGPSDGGAEGYNIAIDASNNIYIVGDFSGTTCDFNPWGAHDYHVNNPPLAPFGELFNAYLSKFDSNGNFIWAKTWGGEGYDDGPGVAVDALGNVYVGGMYSSKNINFDPAGGSGGTGHPAHDSGIVVDVFLSKFNSSGAFQWVRTWGGTGTDEAGQTVTVDSSNNVYIAGRFSCTGCDFNPLGTPDLHSSHGDADAFVSKYDTNGNLKWAKTWGGSGADAAGGLITDSSNHVYATGIFSTSVDFGSGTSIASQGLMDAYVSKFNSDGIFQGVQAWGGSGNDGGGRQVLDSNGNLYVAGWFSNTVNFNPTGAADTHVSNGLEDAFVTILKTATITTPGADIAIGGVDEGAFPIPPNTFAAKSFSSLVTGPVDVTSNDGNPIFASQRVTSGESYNEVMGVPTSQLSTDYWFPAYDHSYIKNVNTDPMRMWVLIGNASTTQNAIVNVLIGGVKTADSPFTILPGGRITPRWIGTKGGPLEVVSSNGVKIFASERVFTYPNNSFNEILGFPANQLTSEYWFPYYDSTSMSNAIQVGNTSSSLAATVDIYIGTAKKGSYSIPANSFMTQSYLNLVDGPVRVVSTNGVSVVASQISLSGPSNAFNEVLGYPFNQFSTEYWFPVYDHAFISGTNTNLMRMWVLMGNPGAASAATVDVYIAGVKTADSPFSIPAGGRVTPRWVGVTAGPVRVVATNGVPIFTSERVLTYPNNVFNEMMGLPLNQMSGEYWFPYYDSISMNNDILVSRLDRILVCL